MTLPTTTSPTVVTDTSNKINASLRYLASNVSAGLAVLVVLGSLSPENSAAIIANLHKMYSATQDFVGAFANIWYIVFPLISGWLLKMGVNSSGFGTMMDKVFAAAKSGNVDAQLAIVNAAASKELGTEGIVNPALAANPATAPLVVARSEEIPPARAS